VVAGAQRLARGAARGEGDLAVIIENEFTVGADIDTVWRELLDMEGVASCLPGATITGTGEPNVYDGSMRLKIGPMRVEYRGRATLSEVDEANHTAVISLSAREAKGQGSAMATIRNRLESVDAGTRVKAETDLQITGPQAQFGRGVIEDVGKRVLGEFSQRLEERIAGSGSGGGGSASSGAPATGEASAPTSGNQAPAELDVGSLVTSSPVVRRAGAGALVAALIAVALILLRRRR
jgi:carbon monoxide dehydrogenase subunit G